MSLRNVRIVLLDTTHPGNIGGAARAMKNMGLGQLYLVSPREFPSEAAIARASGARDVLDAAVRCDFLDEAISGCSLVIGASARKRTIAWPGLSPREAAQELVVQVGAGDVALLFGQERAGLTNAQVERCHYLVTIPSNPDYSSLNLVCAVQVLAYELLLAAGQVPAGTALSGSTPPATTDQMRRFYGHLEEVLLEIDFLDPRHSRKLRRKLVRFFARARPDQEEMNILRGILTAVQQTQRHKT